ncbi:MAG: hypothetical protein J7M25_16715 [Deltaproteobacteria bacterium]|nr:hypothetical protein [Deltaproteobacteria bacterium]
MKKRDRHSRLGKRCHLLFQSGVMIPLLAVVVAGPHVAGCDDDSGDGPQASCTDGTRNQDETDIDCGGAVCAACGDGQRCNDSTDCLSGLCEDGVCQHGTSGPYVAFVDPTEPDGAEVSKDWTDVAVEWSGGQGLSLVVDWKETLVAHFDFEGAGGETASDLSGHSNDGVVEGGASTVQGRFGAALLLDGRDDRVVISSGTDMVLTGPLTVEAWIRPDRAQEICEGQGANHGIIAKCDEQAQGTNRCSWQLRYGAPTDKCRLGFMIKEGPETFRWISVHQDLDPDMWYHVAAVYDGTTAKLYVDGSEMDRATVAGIMPSQARLMIGDAGYGDLFEGALDEVRLHARALSTEEISASCGIADGSLTRRFDGLVSGDYRYQAKVVDAQGRWAQTERRMLHVELSTDPCEGVTCSGHGTCRVESGRPTCDCEEGYHVVGNIYCEQVRLLFRSVFGDGVTMEDAAQVQHPRILGLDAVTGFRWETDVPGSPADNLFNNMNDSGPPYNLYADERIESIPGPDGSDVRALFMAFIGDDPSNGAHFTRSMYNFYPDRTSSERFDRFLEMYVKADAKMHMQWVQDQPQWRLMMEWVSYGVKWRWGLYVSKVPGVNGGQPYFRLQQEQFYDAQGNPDRRVVVNEEAMGVDVPLDEWFTLEVSWSDDVSDGWWKVAVDGVVVCQFSGQTAITSGNPSYGYNPFKVYGVVGHTWYTNFELWDRPPSSSILAQ